MTETQPPTPDPGEVTPGTAPPPGSTTIEDVTPQVDEKAIDDLPMGGGGSETEPPTQEEVQAAQAATDSLPMGGKGASAAEPK